MNKEKMLETLRIIKLKDIVKIIAFPKLTNTMVVQVIDFRILRYDNNITFDGINLLTNEIVKFKKRDVMENYGIFTIEEFIEKYPERLI